MNYKLLLLALSLAVNYVLLNRLKSYLRQIENQNESEKKLSEQLDKGLNFVFLRQINSTNKVVNTIIIHNCYKGLFFTIVIVYLIYKTSELLINL